MKSTDIAFLMTGDLHRNIRALKQLRSLSEHGFTVKAYHLGGSVARTVLPKGVTEEVVPVPPGRGPLYFKALSRAFSRAIQGSTAALYHASDLYTLSACAAAARKNGTQYSYDSRELYAHVAATRGRPWVRWWWSKLEGKLISGAACVFTVSDSIADRLEVTYKIERPIVVHNVPEVDPLSETASSTADINYVPPQTMAVLLDDRGLASNVPILVHLGQMKKDRGCENLIKAMPSVRKAHLVFLGFGPLELKLKELVGALRLHDRVHFIAPVPPRAVHIALTGATIGVTMLEDTCLNHRFALPNKLFDYLKAGLPVLSSNLTEVKRVVDLHECGMVVNPASPEDIANGINTMIDSPLLSIWAENARTASETFSWDKATQRFMLAINRVLTPSKSS
jgi:glycosyltransferase involved in cell wall biosynthesis